MSLVAKVAFTTYNGSISKALDLVSAADRLPQEGLIIIKPNLTNARRPPITTDVRAVEAVYLYCRDHCGAEIAIGEGCGDGETQDTFKANGYTELAEKHAIRLIDFNQEPAVRVERKDALQWKEFYLPQIARDAFIISLPVLKDHSFTVTTISMKNMFGLAPAPYYKGGWNKSKLHSPSTHKSVFDVCLYKAPDLSVVDASLASAGHHLSGRTKRLGVILASFDPVAADAIGSQLMGHDPRRIEYLTLANGILGDMDKIEVVEG